MLYHIYIDDKYYKSLNSKTTISIGDTIRINSKEYTVRKVIHNIIDDNCLSYVNVTVYCY